MSNKKMTFLRFSLVSLLSVLAVAAIAVVSHNHVYADTNPSYSLDNLCIPSETKNPPAVDIQRYLKISFIDRASVQVDYLGGGTCSNLGGPSNPNVPVVTRGNIIAGTSSPQFSTYEQGVYTDSNTDGTYIYAFRANGPYGTDPAIHNFSGAMGTGKKDPLSGLGGHNDIVAVSNVNQFLNSSVGSANIVFTIPGNNIPSPGNCDNYVSGSAAALASWGGSKMQWGCVADASTVDCTLAAGGSCDTSHNQAGYSIRSVVDTATIKNFNITFDVVAGSDGNPTIVPVATGDQVSTKIFSQCNDKTTWGVNNCQGPYFISGLSNKILTDIGSGTKQLSVHDKTGKSLNIIVAGPNNASSSNSASTVKPSTTGGNNLSLTCNAGFNPLNWLICGIVNGMVSIVGNLDGVINSQLSVGSPGSSDNPNQIFCDSTSKGSAVNSCTAYESAWSGFRDIALGLMVAAGLVILISQALGFEFLDAYTMRKVLPRLVIMALVITLSWQLMRFFVTLTNDLGLGIQHLIYAPFVSKFGNSTVNIGGGNDVALTLVGAGAITAMGIFGLLSFAATAALAVFVGFILIILRQLVVIALIIIAPLALAMYIMPNTQKYYKLWWESFSKALIMFPLIVGLIAIGRVFAAIAAQQGGNDPINALIAFAAYFAPYFALPLTFRFAGGLMSSAANFVNGRSQGAFNGLRKWRSGEVAKNMQSLKDGTRVKGHRYIPGSQKFARGFGEVSKGVGSGWNGRFGLGERGRDARHIAGQAAAARAGENPTLRILKGANDVNRILASANGNEKKGRDALTDFLTENNSEGLSPQQIDGRVNEATRRAKIAGGFTKANGVAAFKQMVADGTAIKDGADLTTLAATVGDGDRYNTYAYAADAASVSRQVGRHDVGSSSEATGMAALAAGDSIYGKTGASKMYTGSKSEALLQYEVWKSSNGTDQSYGRGGDKGASVKNQNDIAKRYFLNPEKEVAAVAKGDISKHDVRRDAAVKLFEEQQMTANGSYSLGNREIQAAQMDSDTQQKLDAYMAEAAVDSDGKVKTKPDDTAVTNGEEIRKVVSDRMAAMSEAERAAMISRGENPGAAGARGGNPGQQ